MSQDGNKKFIPENNDTKMSHSDSIEHFVSWFNKMCDTFCSLTTLKEFSVVGPKKNEELKTRFSTWHVKLTDSDKKAIEVSFKRNMKRLIKFSSNFMNDNGFLDKPVTQEQIDIMIEMGETGFDIVMDTTAYLDHFVKFAVDNYNPPSGK